MNLINRSKNLIALVVLTIGMNGLTGCSATINPDIEWPDEVTHIEFPKVPKEYLGLNEEGNPEHPLVIRLNKEWQMSAGVCLSERQMLLNYGTIQSKLTKKVNSKVWQFWK